MIIVRKVLLTSFTADLKKKYFFLFQGIYRITCEHVLKVLKEGRETLLTLLEAFVYDPLIDWTPLNEGGYTGAVYGGGRELASETKQSKKELEKEVTCSMYKVRITEAKHQWLENKLVT